jgi:XTP/dITP diphosphohydrolase
MIKLIFATHNQNKVQEVNAVFHGFAIQSLAELDYHVEVEETEKTLVGNALLKARSVYAVFKTPVFADDSGLEVDALDGAPGVFSARFAGEDKNHDKNNEKLLNVLHGITNRTAQFRTVIAYKDEKQELLFEGIVRGCIASECTGTGGFGYDPLFIPEGYKKTFGELPREIKLKLSHRSRAIAKLHEHLKSLTEC